MPFRVWFGGSALYGKPVCNLIGLAFNSSPLDGLVVVAAPDRHFLFPKKDNDITFRNTVVASYTNFGGVRASHEFAANRFTAVNNQAWWLVLAHVGTGSRGAPIEFPVFAVGNANGATFRAQLRTHDRKLSCQTTSFIKCI
jgi:hypothetical protein